MVTVEWDCDYVEKKTLSYLHCLAIDGSDFRPKKKTVDGDLPHLTLPNANSYQFLYMLQPLLLIHPDPIWTNMKQVF